MYKSSVKWMMLVTISTFKGKFNLCKAYNTIEGCNFVKKYCFYVDKASSLQTT